MELLDWTTSTDDRAVAGYSSTATAADIAFTNGTTWSDSSLAPTQTYTYQVRAVDASGNVSAVGSANVGVCSTVSDPTLHRGEVGLEVPRQRHRPRHRGGATPVRRLHVASGAGILGYGRGDEGTVVSFGPNPSLRS